MNELDFNTWSIIISTVALFISIYTCHQNSKIVKLSNRANVVMYLVSSSKATYVKVKNVGHSPAKIVSFKTDVDVEKVNSIDQIPFPLVGLENIVIAPNTSKIAKIDNKYLEQEHWIEIKYFDYLTQNNYTFNLPLKTYKEFALVSIEDFNLIDY